MKAWKAELLLVFVTMVWGGTFIFTKLGLNDTTPSLFILMRFSIAMLIAVIVFNKKLLKINKTILYQGILLGLFFGGGFVLQTWGLKLTSVTKSAFITGITVVFTPFVFKLVAKRKLLFYPKLGVIIAFIGLWLFTNPKFDNFNVGDIITLISTLFWAFYIVFMDKFTQGKSNSRETAQLVTLQFVGAASVALLSHIFMEGFAFRINPSPVLITALAYNGILASFVLTFIHTSYQRFTTPVKAALIFSLEPVFASIIAFFAINEILNGREYIGAGILFLGVLVSELGDYTYRLITGKRK